MARYPAVPILGPRLSPGAVIVMDDTTRPDEAEVSRWHADLPGSTLELVLPESGAAILTIPTAG